MQLVTLLTTLTLAGLTTAQPTPHHQPEERAVANTGKLTYYAPGLGACGVTNTANDMIVAVSPSVFGTYANPNASPACQKSMTITCPSGKTVKAAVKDRCAGCGPDDIDVSPAVFQLCGALSIGAMHVSWVMD